MRLNESRYFQIAGCVFILLTTLISFAQTPSAARRITGIVNDQDLITRTGNVHRLARPQYDRGAAPDSLPADRLLLLLQRGPEQEAALKQFLDQQHIQSSTNYHRWLTPDEFGQMFGPSDADIATVTNWLISHGFQVNNVGAGRTAIEFSGNAGQVRDAFHTEIHKFVVNGEDHWANASNPRIPAALAPVVGGVVSLNNFRSKPLSHKVATAEATKPNPAQPEFTLSCGGSPCYGVGPADFATIYNVQPLWDAGTDGTNQTIAIVGRTNINIQDVRDFRTLFGLPANDPQIVLNGPDPGIVSTDEEMEADLDVQWSGAVAKNAKIKFVVSQSTDVIDGIDLSALYIVDNNLAPVMSTSFGTCEVSAGTYTQFIGAIWEQAAAQGITSFVSTGDNGSAGCDDQTAVGIAENGLGVNALASSPFNVAVGGTDFDQNSTNFSTYWNSTNNAVTHASAKSYIPETTWNESCAPGTTDCQKGSIWAGSGGSSSVFPKPSWQSGAGVPQDGHRDLPDVSLFASLGSVTRSAYIVCQADAGTSCSGTLSLMFVGGTSAASPSFAGIMALVDQYQANHGGSARQGNANYTFYKLAVQNGARCDPSTVGSGANSCIFYDTQKGNNSVPCTAGSLNCSSGKMVDSNSNPAWAATAGYDMATGLGSVNAKNLATNWANAGFTPTLTTITNLVAPAVHGGTANVTVTVAPNPGSGTPTGDVSLIATYPGGATRLLTLGSLSSGSLSGTTTFLAGGSYNLTAHYAGDGTFAASDSAPQSVTISPEPSKTIAGLITYDINTGNVTSLQASTAPYGSPYILEVNVTNAAGSLNQLCYNGAGAPGTISSNNMRMCPSGTISLTDNGSPLDGGTFALNTLGFADDQAIQLPAGNHNIFAIYSGDNSFQTSNGTTSITISKAITGITTPSPDSGSVGQGNTVNIAATVTTISNGAAPTGTVTFYSGGVPLSGQVTYVGTPAQISAATVIAPASLKATIAASFSTVGTKTITAQYNGDSNYAASALSGSTTIQVSAGMVPTSITAPSLQPASPVAGSNATVTAVVNTTSLGAAPTGTVDFFADGTKLTGSVSQTGVNGAGTVTASLITTLTTSFQTSGTKSITAKYNGDATYAASPTSAATAVQVTAAPDFSVSSLPVTITTPGQSGTSSITVTSIGGYTGSVALTCAVNSAVAEAPGCSLNPASVSPAANATTNTTLTITTTGAHQIAGLSRGTIWLSGGVFAIALFGIPGMRRRSGAMLLCLVIGLAVLGGTVACGGGGGTSSSTSGSSIKTDPGTPAGTYTVTVTATATVSGVPTTHTTNVSVTVQ